MATTVTMLLDKRRVKTNGLYPVKVRVTYQRIQQYYSTGVSLNEEDFQKVMAANPRKAYVATRVKLDERIGKIRRIIDSMDHFTFSKLDILLEDSPKSVNDIFPLFEAVATEKRSIDKIKTAETYELTAKILKRFQQKIGFYDVNAEFLKKFERWMLADEYSPTTIGIHLRNLRAIYNKAIAMHLIKDASQYPFKKQSYVIPSGKNVKKALTKEEVKKIAALDVFHSKTEQWARDMWLFSYLSNGLNPNDIFRIKKAQVNGDFITLVRRKTQDTTSSSLPIVIYLRPEAKEIIQRWQSSDSEFLFDGLTSQMIEADRIKAITQLIKQINKYMKRIAGRLEINKPCTCYCARHSFATIMKNSGQSIELISEALGHSSTNTTKAYLASFREEIIEKAAENLL